MVLPKLPNEIIMTIIKQADGGLTAHKKKMSETLKNISLGPNCRCRQSDEDDPDWHEGYEEGYERLLCNWGYHHTGGLYHKNYQYCDRIEELYHYLELEERFNHIWPEHKGSIKCYAVDALDYYRNEPKSKLINSHGFSQDDIDSLFKPTLPEEKPKQNIAYWRGSTRVLNQS